MKILKDNENNTKIKQDSKFLLVTTTYETRSKEKLRKLKKKPKYKLKSHQKQIKRSWQKQKYIITLYRNTPLYSILQGLEIFIETQMEEKVNEMKWTDSTKTKSQQKWKDKYWRCQQLLLQL